MTGSHQLQIPGSAFSTLTLHNRTHETGHHATATRGLHGRRWSRACTTKENSQHTFDVDQALPKRHIVMIRSWQGPLKL
jgi:hypothetical protein